MTPTRALVHRRHLVAMAAAAEPAAGAAARRRPSQGALVDAALSALPVPLGAAAAVDIGANLCDPSFDADRGEVLARAARAGVSAVVVTGSCARTSAAAAELAAAHAAAGAAPRLFFTAGVHPHNARHWRGARDAAALLELAAHPLCAAVGECGLDFNRNFSPPAAQEAAFAAQLELAERAGRPLFLHCRDAWPRFAALLRRHRRAAPGVVHCFTGGRAELEELLGMGLHVGVTGWVDDDRPARGGRELAALLPLVPDDRLLIETDCPYLVPRRALAALPAAARPRRNEPALLPLVAAAVAAARGQTAEHVAAASARNARALFGLDRGGDPLAG